MAVEISREGWLQLFIQTRTPTMFLSRFFTVKPGGIYNGDKIAVDIQRFGEEVAIAVKKCTGPNLNDFDEFTTKEFTPPSYSEGIALDVCELLNRMAGVDPYTAAGQAYAAQLVQKMVQGFGLIDDKIKRSVELQASQIMQTGTLTLTNAAGDTVYELDFKPKATHFPTTGTSWSTIATADPIGDMSALSSVIRVDGRIDTDIIIMGNGAYRNFYQNAEVKDVLDNRRMEFGGLTPRMTDSGAGFGGTINIDGYDHEIWTYRESYTDPETLLPVKYIEDDKVVMLSSRTRLDTTSARVPLPLGPDPRVAHLLPGRLASRSESFDVTPNVYCSPNGKQIMGELESRPLLLPIQIDGFGCLDTEI